MFEEDLRLERAQRNLVDVLLRRLEQIEEVLRAQGISVPALDEHSTRAIEEWVRLREAHRRAESEDARR